MELKKIQIKNFRSIKDADIQFNHNCLILLGKNEAGKSNILKAIAAVFGKYQISPKDKRKKIDNEKIDREDFFIRAIIELNNKDFLEIEKRFKNKFNNYKIQYSDNITLIEFIRLVFNNLLIDVFFNEIEEPELNYWENENTKLKNIKIISENSNPLEESTQIELEEEVFEILKELYLENPIKCHYWQYNDSFLLPNTIDINSFTNNPSDYKAIENIFQLCGRENIKEEFENALLQDGDYINLLDQVSKKTTQTFQKIWNDFKGTSIQFISDGHQILIKIVEKARYNCEDRSEGFKKFISILLMLSTQSRSKKIYENDLILIDEPDQSLYPTSAQFLKDELLTIAKKTKIIYSTHSQYMIDTNNLDRHIIVEKKDDVTTLNKEDANAPYTTDELLKRAIGSSIFECLKPINIVFEGYLDKKLFEQFCQWNKKDDSFKDFGRIYLQGISGIDSIVSILDAANKKFIVVADSDSASLDKRKEFEKEHPDYKSNWLAYADVVPSISTMEDFLTEGFVNTEIIKMNPEYVYDSTKNAIQNIEKAINKDKGKKQVIKNSLIANLKNEHIKEEYVQYLEELKNKLNNL
jgi:predicted ATP-dependent endonuclease of OLD family